MVDALDSKSSSEDCAGSRPVTGTTLSVPCFTPLLMVLSEFER